MSKKQFKIFEVAIIICLILCVALIAVFDLKSSEIGTILSVIAIFAIIGIWVGLEIKYAKFECPNCKERVKFTFKDYLKHPYHYFTSRYCTCKKCGQYGLFKRVFDK